MPSDPGLLLVIMTIHAGMVIGGWQLPSTEEIPFSIIMLMFGRSFFMSLLKRVDGIESNPITSTFGVLLTMAERLSLNYLTY
jgi:hypothetical protein